MVPLCAQIGVRNIARVKICESVHRVEWITPNLPSLGLAKCPKCSQRRRVSEVGPQIFVAHDLRNRASRNVFGNSFLCYEIKAGFAIEAFQVPVFVEMLHGASNIVNCAHRLVMTRADEQFGSALELLLSLPGIGQNQAINAAGVLMQPLKNIGDRARLRIEVQRSE